MNSKKLLALHICGALLLTGFCSAASAQEVSDKWEISAAYFQPRLELDLRSEATLSDGTDSYTESGSWGVHDSFRGAQLEATWRPTPRQRVVLGAYNIDNKRHYGYDQDLDANGNITTVESEVEYEVYANARVYTDFSLYRVSYGFDVVQSERLTVTALAGVYAAKVKAFAQSSGNIITPDDTYDLTGRVDLNETRYAPGIGLAGEWRPTQRWSVRTQVQGFKTSWGDFSNDGHFIHAQAQLGYAFTPKVTGFVGYDWFELDLKKSVSREATVDGVDYTLDASLGGRLHVHGPTVGIRARF